MGNRWPHPWQASCTKNHTASCKPSRGYPGEVIRPGTRYDLRCPSAGGRPCICGSSTGASTREIFLERDRHILGAYWMEPACGSWPALYQPYMPDTLVMSECQNDCPGFGGGGGRGRCEGITCLLPDEPPFNHPNRPPTYAKYVGDLCITEFGCHSVISGL